MPTRGLNEAKTLSKENKNMAETATQSTTGENQANGTVTTSQEGQRSFTQEEVNSIVTDRLKRESAKYADYEELKALNTPRQKWCIIQQKGDDQSVREWYYANVHDIINQIDETKPFEEQVREAYKLRIKYKHEARVAMYDRQKAEKLEKKFPAVSFEELLRDKMRRKNISKEDALNDILITASTTNQKVDDLYILGD